MVELLNIRDIPEIVSVLCEAFYAYPVMWFVIGQEGVYKTRLERLVRFFVQIRAMRNEVLLGIRTPAGLDAVAVVSYPGRRTNPPEVVDLREQTWAELGTGARARYEAFSSAAAQFDVEGEHIHLNIIGARDRARGRGHGRKLLEAVHALSLSDSLSSGVTLTTETEANVQLYRYFGYRILGLAPVESAFMTWSMYRPDP